MANLTVLLCIIAQIKPGNRCFKKCLSINFCFRYVIFATHCAGSLLFCRDDKRKTAKINTVSSPLNYTIHHHRARQTVSAKHQNFNPITTELKPGINLLEASAGTG
ncbi:MAG: hypothetical protein KAJ63_03885, partial [Methyloprofundus sp.]|nr:hypothetical protein [Methyloprofundus sp.]